MNIAIIGFELEGKSAFEYWSAKGATITICDRNAHKVVPSGVNTQLGDDYLQNLNRFDVIVRSAGVPPAKITEANPEPEIISKITTVVEEFLRVCPTKNTIGITGTKGKGTTSTLVAQMLQNAGEQVFLGGNIGRSPFDFLPEVTPDSWVVLELSSYQLSDIKVGTHIAACLMIAPDHLNWHEGFDEYIIGKAQLFKHQTKDDTAVYLATNEHSHTIADYSPGTLIPYFDEPGAIVTNDGDIAIGGQTICHTSELQLLGKHNWQNACAAVTIAWQATHDVAAMRDALVSFTGLEHRLEFVRDLDGVRYYDDSFGTTPETAIVAMEAFHEPKVMIMGGSDKGAPFDALGPAVMQSNVRHVILIGQMAERIEAILRGAGFTAITPGGETMPEAVAAAQKAAQPGDIVLLSTACASFGMFSDYKARGEAFQAAVKAL